MKSVQQFSYTPPEGARHLNSELIIVVCVCGGGGGGMRGPACRYI